MVAENCHMPFDPTLQKRVLLLTATSQRSPKTRWNVGTSQRVIRSRWNVSVSQSIFFVFPKKYTSQRVGTRWGGYKIFIKSPQRSR